METPQDESWYPKDAQSKKNNRILDIPTGGWGYDQVGNVTAVAGMARSFTYDAENRQVTAVINTNASSYTYDGDGGECREWRHRGRRRTCMTRWGSWRRSMGQPRTRGRST
jgi:hypothetical protein